MAENKTYDVVLIDLDGTLTDSRPGIINAIRYALDKMHLPMPEEEKLNYFIGPPLLDSFARHCGLTGERGLEVLSYYREYYNRQGKFENSVYPGVFDMLKELKMKGKRLIVATSKPEVMSRAITDHFGLSEYFEYVAGASLDESRNNKPAVIRYALKACGIRLKSGGIHDQNVIMVGDRIHDVEGAHEIGIECIGVLYGYGTEEELKGAGADYIAATCRDVADLILT